jgi:S-adenosylmethionine:tRNA ribosyltransferase-isomerase
MSAAAIADAAAGLPTAGPVETRSADRSDPHPAAPLDMRHFRLPPELEAAAPPEARGIRRDAVRLLVARRHEGTLSHRRFTELADLLEAGDVLVVNTSATLPASLDARTTAGQPASLQLSSRLPGGLWVVELRHRGPGPAAGPSGRRPAGDQGRRPTGRPPESVPTTPWLDAESGTVVSLPAGGQAELRLPASAALTSDQPVRLWVATLRLPEPLLSYLARHGRPIRYGYVGTPWPISCYQTVFAEVPGSAEMPSAARPFSTELITRLVARGVVIAPFILHCGVSSPEDHEPPAAEWFRVPTTTANQINGARSAGHRVIAVGTTAVRALETVTDDRGTVHPGEGWTELVVTADRQIRAVDALLTGWHEPGASHLAMLEAIAGPELVSASYEEALTQGYLWHEFGDSHLVLP